MTDPVRIANVSGFYGDRFSAMTEQIAGGQIDVLTGDYLAELTMLILWKAKQKAPERGYAVTFLKQMREVLGEVSQRGIKVVANAGGLNPAGLADDLRAIAQTLDIDVSIAHVEGDDFLPRLGAIVEEGHELRNIDTSQSLADLTAPPLTANAYLGAWGIVEALNQDVDIVVTGRVADAALVVGPAAWHHGWKFDGWDRLAGAVVAGHILECGTQATGGNFSFFDEIADLTHPGFPIAEVAEDGSSVITKHQGTGGAVTVDTVTAQILYEIGDPAYLTPDVVAHFDTIKLDLVGDDRVRVTDVRGSKAPKDLKAAINYLGGYRNSMTLVLVGMDAEKKAALVEDALTAELGGDRVPNILEFLLSETGISDAEVNAQAASTLTITPMDPNPDKVGRSFSSAVVELALGSYPGFFATAPPSGESPYGVYWPALIPRSLITHEVVFDDGSRVVIPDPPHGDPVTRHVVSVAASPAAGEETRRAPLGTIAGARSGDKGGNANIGLWVRSDEAYRWLAHELTSAKLQELLPETTSLFVERFELPNIRGLNFVVHGLLGDGVASSTRFDPQAKSLGEWLRSRTVDIPISLLDPRV
ncbi:MAG: acyclic terpene utilization AtuA family protein [Acidimicrobiia bacterium]